VPERARIKISARRTAATGYALSDRPNAESIWPTTTIGPAIKRTDMSVTPTANRTKNRRLTFRHGNSPAGGHGSSSGHHWGRGRGDRYWAPQRSYCSRYRS
jgi:hypothetical protein